MLDYSRPIGDCALSCSRPRGLLCSRSGRATCILFRFVRRWGQQLLRFSVQFKQWQDCSLDGSVPGIPIRLRWAYDCCISGECPSAREICAGIRRSGSRCVSIARGHDWRATAHPPITMAIAERAARKAPCVLHPTPPSPLPAFRLSALQAWLPRRVRAHRQGAGEVQRVVAAAIVFSAQRPPVRHADFRHPCSETACAVPSSPAPPPLPHFRARHVGSRGGTSKNIGGAGGGGSHRALSDTQRPGRPLTIEQPSSAKAGKMRDRSTDRLLLDRERYRALAGRLSLAFGDAKCRRRSWMRVVAAGGACAARHRPRISAPPGRQEVPRSAVH
jgi:hypothetical protein